VIGHWTLSIEGTPGEVRLARTEIAEEPWSADGPAGTAAGELSVVLRAAIGDAADPAWVTTVGQAFGQDLDFPAGSHVATERIAGRCFHVTYASNRASILRYGLDWRRTTSGGIARGSDLPAVPQAAGVFLTRDLHDAGFFARFRRPARGLIDIWAVELHNQWVISDPNAHGGLNWVLCLIPIAPAQLRLHQQDLAA
jgi:hypothetical protein